MSISDTKNIGGRKYDYYSSHDKKSTAQAVVFGWIKDGRHYRILKEYGRWVVYRRRGDKRR